MVDFILSHIHYWVAIILMMVGFYGVIRSTNLIKKIMGLAVFQTSVLLLYTFIGKVHGGAVPILEEEEGLLYSNPLPHVLMLTAIVVGVATIAVGLAIVVRIKEEYGTIEEDEMLILDQASSNQVNHV